MFNNIHLINLRHLPLIYKQELPQNGRNKDPETETILNRGTTSLFHSPDKQQHPTEMFIPNEEWSSDLSDRLL